MEARAGRVDEVCDFFGTQNAGQVKWLLGIRCIGHAPRFLYRLDEEEAQRGQPLRDGPCGEFPLAKEIRLVLPDVLRTELVGRALEVTREIFHGLEVGAGCRLGVITTLEFLEHHFAQVGHRSSPYDPTLARSRPYQYCWHRARESVRREAAPFKRPTRRFECLTIHVSDMPTNCQSGVRKHCLVIRTNTRNVAKFCIARYWSSMAVRH